MTKFQELSAGHKNCDRCNGSGTYLFQGVRIFCEQCHDEQKITALYSLMASHFPKQDTETKADPKTWEKNAETLGFADVQRLLKTKPMDSVTIRKG